MIDLEKTDEFAFEDTPDEAVETCLKVLRTIRGGMMKHDLGAFADEIIILSHAHRVVSELVATCQES